MDLSFILFLNGRHTTQAKCIDKYIELQVAASGNLSSSKPSPFATTTSSTPTTSTSTSLKIPSTPIDKRLEDVVDRMFNRCYQDGEYKQAIGIALEAQRLDIVEIAIQKGKAANQANGNELIGYVLESSMAHIQNLEFRNKVILFLCLPRFFLNIPFPSLEGRPKFSFPHPHFIISGFEFRP